MVLRAAPRVRLLRAAAALALSSATLPATGASAQTPCPALAGDATATDSNPRPSGVRYMFASGDFRTEASGARWVWFLTEPTITDVAAASPAAGHLAPGDVVETVDGLLVTTPDGSRRFSRMGLPGSDTTALGVRRDGRTVVVRVPPCAAAAPDPSVAAPDPAAEQDSASAEPEPAAAPDPAAAASGSGMRLRCRDCRYRDGRWRFSSPPRVTGVRAGGPAARAGLRAGDVLVALDGLRLGTTEGNARFSDLGAGDTPRWTVRRGTAELTLTWTVGG